MDAGWREHLEALRRFNAWEDQQLGALAQDYRSALGWMADAWAMARSRNPEWLSEAEGEGHLRHLIEIHRRLERSRLGS